MSKKAPNWYRVKEPSFIGDSLRQEGDYVQFSGTPGSNLESVTEDEVRASGKVIAEPSTEALGNREAELNQREQGLSDREQAVDLRERELKGLSDAGDVRAKQLDQREHELEAREQALEREKAQRAQVAPTVLYTIDHRGAGRYVVANPDGEKIGDFIGSKDEAQAEADRLNAGGAPYVQPGSNDQNEEDKDLPDA